MIKYNDFKNENLYKTLVNEWNNRLRETVKEMKITVEIDYEKYFTKDGGLVNNINIELRMK